MQMPPAGESITEGGELRRACRWIPSSRSVESAWKKRPPARAVVDGGVDLVRHRRRTQPEIRTDPDRVNRCELAVAILSF